MKNHLSRQRGVTMIEVMVTVAIVAIVLAIGVPRLTTWIQNTQVTATADSLMTGLQLARGEAVRKNVRTRFQLIDAGGRASWVIISDSQAATGSFPSSNQIQASGTDDGGANARIGVSTSNPTATGCCTTAIAAGTGMGTSPLPGAVFSAFGQVVSDATVTTVYRIDVTSPTATRRLVILIASSGSAKLCDPSLPATNTRGCP